MNAFYNDTDTFCCDWLQNLMDAELITPGKIDDRSITDIVPDDLVGYERVHLFAGIGGWDYALQIAGWRGPVWTASCPCPPFSGAGKQFHCPRCTARRPVPCPRRTGYFICWNCEHAWLADGRHLWPECWRLVRDGRPRVVMGEQVASADGRVWLAGVRASLEILGYASRCADLCAAGVGAPHIRQRLWWVADARHDEPSRRQQTPENHGRGSGTRGKSWREPASCCGNGRLADADEGQCGRIADGEGCQRDGQAPGWLEGDGITESGGRLGRLAQPEGQQRDRSGNERRGRGESANGGATSGQHGLKQEDGGAGGVGNADDTRLSQRERDGGIRREAVGTHAGQAVVGRSELGHWSTAAWLQCSDGKARRVEPGIFPLADGFPNRVGVLRGAGNAIVPQVAAEFISAYREAAV